MLSFRHIPLTTNKQTNSIWIFVSRWLLSSCSGWCNKSVAEINQNWKMKNIFSHFSSSANQISQLEDIFHSISLQHWQSGHTPEDDYFYILLSYFFYILQSKKIVTLLDWQEFLKKLSEVGTMDRIFIMYILAITYLLSHQPVNWGGLNWLNSNSLIQWPFSEGKKVDFSEIVNKCYH